MKNENSRNRRIRGVIPPMVTPLSPDMQLDVDGAKRLVDHILAGGAHGLFLLGTTGEAPDLPYDVRYELVRVVCEQVRGRVPVLVGITDTVLAESLRLAETGVPEGADRKELNRIRKECKTLLSREEAFQLGHILGFTLEEMSWFLLRVFDFEDGFRYNSSQDLIEAYTFLTDGSWKDAEILKQAYASAASLVPKAETEGRDADWTQGTEISLKDMVEEWNGHPQDRDHRFLLWLSGQAPYLDMPSRTAGAVYRKLALYFYELGTGQIPVPGREAFIREIRKRTDGKTPEMDEKTCRTLSAGLLESNKNLYTSAPDRAKAWRTVSSDANGLPRLIMAGRPDASRSRVQDLLAGEEQVEKGDMLHLLWYGFNLCWGEDPILNGMFELQCNLADFLECAETVLDAALLPPFYPPHMMEQSMMLSIICCVEDTGIPAYNYAELCESLFRPRDRKKKQKAG